MEWFDGVGLIGLIGLIGLGFLGINLGEIFNFKWVKFMG